ncbi:GGDEF domain-containing protein, partial [Paraburkholderia sp. Se-20369]|nr:GGDEF domain-containing protein [Paraburkholderia sp. Se-20369]
AVLLLILLIHCIASLAVLGSLLRARVPGLRSWLVAQALMAVAIVLALVGGAFTAVVGVAAALYAGATLAVLQGFRQFFGVRAVYRAELIAGALLLLALIDFALNGGGPRLRVVFVSAFVAYTRFSIGWLAWRRRPANRSAYSYVFVAVVAVAGALVHATRSVGFMLGHLRDTSVASVAPANVGFLALGVLSLLCLSMGVVMLAHDRVAEHLERLATVDGLTGAMMRGAFLERAEQQCLRAVRTGVPLSLAIVDLDNFKTINDRHGHAAGDQALAHFAAIVSGGIRPCDLFGRLGGEEFAVLCPDTAEGDATRAIERL